MNDVIHNFFQICLSTTSGLIGSVAGLITATGVWSTVDFEYRKAAAILTYILIYGICVIIGIFIQRKRDISNSANFD